MRIDIVTIFPEYFTPLSLSLIGKAQKKRILDLAIHDLRDATEDVHRTVDDSPAGGGAGMVMKPEPWGRILDRILEEDVCAQDASEDSVQTGIHARKQSPDVCIEKKSWTPEAETQAQSAQSRPSTDVLKDTVLIFPSPAGEVFTQRTARELTDKKRLIFGCGRYEGIDQRVFDEYTNRVDTRLLSIGDYVLNGGEVATLVMVEAIVRLLPQVLGNPGSLLEESHENNLLEYPNYTKPAQWRGHNIPEVLLSGHHQKIAQWRYEQSIERTKRERPDLYERFLRSSQS